MTDFINSTMTYKIVIVFDTNTLRGSENKSINDLNIFAVERLRKFIDDNEVTTVELCFPEIVLEEWTVFKKDQIKKFVENAHSSLKKLEEIDHKEVKLDSVDIEKKTEEIKYKIIEKYKIKIIPIPKVDTLDIIKRAIIKKAPFKKESKSDAGFKDSVIFLSIKEDALKYGKGEVCYFLVTDDKGFTEEVSEELREDTKQDLIIRGSNSKEVSFIEDILDKKLGLDLGLKEIREKIEIIIDGNREVFRNYLTNQYQDIRNMSHSLVGQKDVEGYSFSSFDIEDFKKEGDNIYTVQCRITADVHYKKQVEEEQVEEMVPYQRTYTQRGETYFRNYITVDDFGGRNLNSFENSWINPLSKDFRLSLIINTKEKSVRVVNISR